MKKLIIFALFLMILLCQTPLTADLFGQAETVKVEKCHKGQPFEYSMTLLERQSKYTVYQLTYPTPKLEFISPDQTVFARLFLPNDWKKGDQPRHGVVCLDVLGGDGGIPGLLGARFANDGFPVLLPVLPFIGQRAKGNGGISTMLASKDALRQLATLFLQVHPELFRGIDLFVARPEVADLKVDVVGASLGSIIACSLAAKDDRIRKIVLLLPGGNLRKIVRNESSDANLLVQALARATKEDLAFLDKALLEVEPLAFAKELRVKADAGEIMMFNAEQDEVIPPECSTELARAIGMEKKRRVFSDVGHYTAVSFLPEILPDLVDFCRDATIPKKSERVFKRDGSDTVQIVAEELLALLQPISSEKGFIDFAADISVTGFHADRCERLGSIQFAKEGKKFRLIADKVKGSPFGDLYGTTMFGEDRFPWLAGIANENSSKAGVAIVGSKNPCPETIGSFLPSEMKIGFQMVLGVLQLLGTEEAPAALRSTLGLRLVKNNTVPYSFEIEKGNYRGKFQLTRDSLRIDRIELTEIQSKKGVIISVQRWNKTAPQTPFSFTPPQKKQEPVTNRELKQVMAIQLEALFELVNGELL